MESTAFRSVRTPSRRPAPAREALPDDRGSPLPRMRSLPRRTPPRRERDRIRPAAPAPRRDNRALLPVRRTHREKRPLPPSKTWEWGETSTCSDRPVRFDKDRYPRDTESVTPALTGNPLGLFLIRSILHPASRPTGSRQPKQKERSSLERTSAGGRKERGRR